MAGLSPADSRGRLPQQLCLLLLLAVFTYVYTPKSLPNCRWAECYERCENRDNLVVEHRARTLHYSKGAGMQRRECIPSLTTSGYSFYS
jgi:hypothetical protein